MNKRVKDISKTIFAGKGRIGGSLPVFVIAEIGCNFEGDIGRAKEMIRKAADAGADAVKFQTFIPEKIASASAKKFWEIEGCPGETQLEEFKEMPQLTLQEYRMLKKEADRLGLVFFSTPSDEASADMLEKLNVPLYKIGSMDITHFPLLRHIAAKKRPIILSTGAATIGEIKDAVSVINKAGNAKIALLHCITNYPTDDINVNLRMISHLIKEFPDIPVGYSDHTVPDGGEGILAAAVALGAVIIEKHFTFNSAMAGYDHAISADYSCLKRIVTQIRRVEKALGYGRKEPVLSEAKARIHARRSLVASKDIAKNTVIKKDMLEVKRPGTGISPKYLETVIGKIAKRKIPKDTVLKWGMVR